MKIRLLHFLIPVTLFLSTAVNAQTSVSNDKTFALFGIESSNMTVLSEIEIILKSEPTLQMVRVDYTKKTVFVVSQEGVTLNAESIQSLLESRYQYVVCSQFGVLGLDETDFNTLFNCLDQ
jgi:hypothetical protein